MKTTRLSPLWIVLFALITAAHSGLAQGTNFTYQGQLNLSGQPASGNYDFRFRLAADPLGNTYVGNPYATNDIAVTNGLFSVAITFGSGTFTGSNYWLEVDVRTNGAGGYSDLTPLQALTPTPYAIFATTASNLSGTLPTGQLNGTVGNGQLAHNSITVNAGAGLSGGGAAALGGSVALTNAGVLSVTGNADITAATTGGAVTLSDTGTSSPTPSTLVKRDGSGNFSAGAITANLVGNATTATNVTGNIADTQLSANVALLNGTNAFTGSNILEGVTIATNVNNAFAGDGSALTGLNAANLTSIGNTNGGSDNFFAGSAGNPAMTGSDNTAIGFQAFFNNTNGADNAAFGLGALFDNTSGSKNTAAGFGALNVNTTGGANTADGFDALHGNTTGSGNTGIGYQALEGVTSGSNNIALGYQAGENITTGSSNIDIGNVGISTDTNIIRIGAGQSQTYIAGVLNGNGGGLTNLNASQLAAGTGLSIQLNSSGAPNVIDGSQVNFVSGGVVGATVGGGGATNYSGLLFTNSVTGNFGTVGGGRQNSAAFAATVAGGEHNTASGADAAMGGGEFNTASQLDVTVGGGAYNVASGQAATVGGGGGNTASGFGSVVSGGGNDYYAYLGNTASGSYATVPGGSQNIASGNYSFAAGQQAQATNNGAFVWADSQTAIFTSTNNDSFNVRAQGGAQFVTSGGGMTIDGATVLTVQQNVDGQPNVIEGSPSNHVTSGVEGATIGGGGSTNSAGFYANVVKTSFGTVSGGELNTVSGDDGVVGGGYDNTASGPASTVGGGQYNVASGESAVVAGGGFYTEANEAQGNYSAIGGGTDNLASGQGSVIGGGGVDQVGNPGGNIASGGAATVPGGWNNLASGNYSFAAGQQAQATNNGAFVWADSQNAVFGSTANNQFNVRAGGGARFVTSGAGMTVDGLAVATLGAAQTFTATNIFSHAVGIVSTSPEALLEIQGGADNTGANDQHDISLAYHTGGYRHWIRSRHNISAVDNAIDFFVNTNSSSTASSAPGVGNVLVMSLNGGNVGIANAEPTHLLVVGSSGSPAYCDGTTWQNGSDRNSKEGFAAVDPGAVLEKLSALPIMEWKYKVEAGGARHIGPMAQDFHTAFGLNGGDDTHIATIDEEGVALAAIQGLNTRVEAQAAKLKEKDAQIDALKQRLDTLEKLIRDSKSN